MQKLAIENVTTKVLCRNKYMLIRKKAAEKSPLASMVLVKRAGQTNDQTDSEGIYLQLLLCNLIL